jgi:hypothetical protein
MRNTLRTQLALMQLVKARMVHANKVAVKEYRSYWFGRFNQERNALIHAIRDTETMLGKPHRHLPSAGKNQWGGK